MATQINPSHPGLDRVIEGAEAGQALFKDAFSAKNVPTFVLGLTLMAIVTFVSRQVIDGSTSFFAEWAMLSFIALVTFGLFARTIVRATRSVQRSVDTLVDSYRIGMADRRYWESAQRDPRVMNELLAAQSRQYGELTNDAAPAHDPYAPQPSPIRWVLPIQLLIGRRD